MEVPNNFSEQNDLPRSSLPNVMRMSGKLIYSEPQNPYETVEVYLDTEHGFILKCLISEHSPDGCSSWEAIYIDEKNLEKLKKIVTGDIEAFLAGFWSNRSSGMFGFRQFLNDNEIEYNSKYYL